MDVFFNLTDNTMKTLEEEQKEWFDTNAPYGKELGYPDCCIKAFCDQPPSSLKIATKNDKLRYEAACVNGKFKGFIPCLAHAKQINAGEITLDSLIKNRNPEFKPFPLEGHYEKEVTEMDAEELNKYIENQKAKATLEAVYVMTGTVAISAGLSMILKTKPIPTICFSMAAVLLVFGHYKIKSIKNQR